MDTLYLALSVSGAFLFIVPEAVTTRILLSNTLI